MKRVTMTICAATFLLFACNNETKSDSVTKDSTDNTKSKTEEAWIPVDSAAAEKAWMEYATPGKIHEMMASWNGTWTGEMSSWMSADAPPTTVPSTAVSTMIMGNRYQQTKHTSSFMGMPFEGVATVGYDNAKKVFVSSWYDNMGTGIMHTTGPWDEATKTMVLTGTTTDPSRGKDCPVREVFKVVDDNTQLMEMYGPDPMTGKEYKMMEIKFTRKK